MSHPDPGALPLPLDYQPIPFKRSGLLIVIEGVGGSGKSTLAANLAERFEAQILHTAPAPLRGMQRYVNDHCRALPHLLFYLAGAMHVSDLARATLEDSAVIIDRYTGSLQANHSAVQGTSIEEAAALIDPFRHYLLTPDVTFYLDAHAADVAARTSARRTANPHTRDPLTDAPLIESIRARFRQLADYDTTGIRIDTHGKSPDQISTHAHRLLQDFP